MAQTYSAFFYGTLMHPSILRRVIGHEGADLQICPAILLYADYPGVIPYEKSVQLLGHDLPPEDRAVRGTLVKGLNAADIALLDVFEGDEYTRKAVSVHPLSHFMPLSSNEATGASIVPSTPPPVPSLSSLAPPTSANIYMWSDYLERLLPEIWEYEQFVRDNAYKWVGDGSASNKDYLEVDRRRDMGGIIINALEPVEPSNQQEAVKG